jgi:hypothetical protein
LQSREGLSALDPLTGSQLWTRSDVPMRSRFFADGPHLFVVELNENNQPAASRAVRAADGVTVRVPDFTGPYQRHTLRVGHTLLVPDTDRQGGLTLRLYDVLTGKDVWQKTFAAHALQMHCTDPNLAGVVEPNGKVTAIDLRTRQDVLHADMDPKHLDQVKEVHLVGDRTHFYVMCRQPTGPTVAQNGGPFSNVFPGAGFRIVPVNGRVLAFERDTGKELWEADAPEQMLALDFLGEMPALFFTSRFQRRAGMGDNPFVYAASAVKLIDRDTGKLLYDQPDFANGQAFHAFNRNPQTGALELVSATLKVIVSR